MWNKTIKRTVVGAALWALTVPVLAETKLTMFYPVAVGGALTKIVDSIVADFEAANPDIDVNAIYAGNYVGDVLDRCARTNGLRCHCSF